MSYTTMLCHYYVDDKHKGRRRVYGFAVNCGLPLQFAVHREPDGEFVATEWRTGYWFYRSHVGPEQTFVSSAIELAKKALANGIAEKNLKAWERYEI